MGERTITERRCDRPGCDNRVTDKGLTSAGLVAEGGPRAVVLDTAAMDTALGLDVLGPDDPSDPTVHAPDLCRECTASLRTWWTGIDRRRINASAGGDSSDPTPEPVPDGSKPELVEGPKRARKSGAT
jgi:hypothetical protein